MNRQQILNELGIETWIPKMKYPGTSEQIGTSSEEATEVAVKAFSEASDAQQTSLEEGEPLEQLAADIQVCQKCPLGAVRTHAVPGAGHLRARWMFVGEAPGAEEDRQGKPFVGRAGQLLGNIIGALGMKREEVFITNVLKCRPPNNRDPQASEIESCRGYLQQQIKFIDPDIVIALGAFSARELLQNDKPIGKLRGQVHQLPDTQIPCIATYHPAYLLRDPGQKGKVWEDMLLARSVVT